MSSRDLWADFRHSMCLKKARIVGWGCTLAKAKKSLKYGVSLTQSHFISSFSNFVLLCMQWTYKLYDCSEGTSLDEITKTRFFSPQKIERENRHIWSRPISLLSLFIWPIYWPTSQKRLLRPPDSTRLPVNLSAHPRPRWNMLLPSLRDSQALDRPNLFCMLCAQSPRDGTLGPIRTCIPWELFLTIHSDIERGKPPILLVHIGIHIHPTLILTRKGVRGRSLHGLMVFSNSSEVPSIFVHRIRGLMVLLLERWFPIIQCLAVQTKCIVRVCSGKF